jgi:sigma-E factor negative regulatory protein RseC
MLETGTVIKLIDKDYAQVQFKPGAACFSCRACVGFLEGGQRVMEAQNKVRAKIGDVVVVQVAPKQVVAASFLVYIVPLFFLFLGYGFGGGLSCCFGFFAKSEVMNIGLGLGFMLLSFIILRRVEVWAGQRGWGRGQIIKILKAA